MSDGIERKKSGFLPYRLGKTVIYCNRKYGSLWYKIVDGRNVNIDSPSFESAKGGLLGLSIYQAERGGKEGWKMALILADEDDQVYHFETGLSSLFGKGMLWGLSAMTDEQLKGKIGINPTPADPTRTQSRNAGTILYCNMFANRVEMPYFPGGNDHDWREIIRRVLSRCNGCEVKLEDVPGYSEFMDDDALEEQTRNSSTRTPAQTQQPGRSTGQNVRSGVSYPIQPPNAPRGLQATAYSTVEAVTQENDQEFMTEEEIGMAYSEIMLSLDQAYIVNNKKIDGDRMQKVLDRVGATEFDQLSINVKNQVVCTLALELIESKYPQHSVVSRLRGLAKKGVNNEVFKAVEQALLAAFSPSHVIQPDSDIPF